MTELDTMTPATDAAADTASGGVTRRTALAAVGGLTAAGVLAACSSSSATAPAASTPAAPALSGSAPAPSASAPAPSDSASAPSGGGTVLGKAADVPVAGGVVYTDAKIVVTQPKAGEFKAFSAICTHQGCTVASVNATAINCACHNSNFSVTDGSVISGPAKGPLAPQSVTVSGGNVILG